jgi:hypothetical protein
VRQKYFYTCPHSYDKEELKFRSYDGTGIHSRERYSTQWALVMGLFEENVTGKGKIN